MEIDSPEHNRENNNESRRNPQQRKLFYRHLLNKVEEIQETDDVGLLTVNELGEILREVNSLDSEWDISDRVGNADETVLDSLVLSAASSMLKKCVTAVDVFSSTYEPADFSNKIVQMTTNEDDEEMLPTDILSLLEEARRIIPQIPEYNYVYGTYDLNIVPQPKQKKERVKEPKEKLQKKAPEQIKTVEKEEESIEEIVKYLHDVLTDEYIKNNEQPISYYQYVIDTDDFANTVGNMFYCSFLIRDGRAEISLDPNGKPLIKPIKKKVLKSFRDNGGVNAQMISAISIEDWERFKTKGFLQKHKQNKSQ